MTAWTLTSIKVASLNVAADADHHQRVDADQAKQQREEAVHLEETCSGKFR